MVCRCSVRPAQERDLWRAKTQRLQAQLGVLLAANQHLVGRVHLLSQQVGMLQHGLFSQHPVVHAVQVPSPPMAMAQAQPVVRSPRTPGRARRRKGLKKKKQPQLSPVDARTKRAAPRDDDVVLTPVAPAAAAAATTEKKKQQKAKRSKRDDDLTPMHPATDSDPWIVNV